MMQEQLMKYSPDTGEERPYPSNAKQWREYHGRVAWMYNPWTGKQRDLLDIGSDVFGELIVPDTAVSHNYCCEVEMPESNVLYDLGEEKVYSHYSKAKDSLCGLSVSQTLDDTEAMILDAVQWAERLLLGTTVVSYWVKFPLAAKVSSKLTREKETLVYLSGSTKTKYYCATEDVAILAQSSVVLLDDDKAKTVEQTT
jgi:hypothetical protein